MDQLIRGYQSTRIVYLCSSEEQNVQSHCVRLTFKTKIDRTGLGCKLGRVNALRPEKNTKQLYNKRICLLHIIKNAIQTNDLNAQDAVETSTRSNETACSMNGDKHAPVGVSFRHKLQHLSLARRQHWALRQLFLVLGGSFYGCS